jgi:ketosteroid isomerase-like protein
MESELLAWKGGAPTTTVARKAIVFGSAPRERTTDGPSFRKAWYATWANHVRIEPQKIAALAPSGTTGWVIANITLDKKTHKVPFRMFVVFDQDAAGNWQLVHVHLATTS